MPVYGYRLFTFNTFRGMAQTPVAVEDCDGSHYLDVAGKVLGGIAGSTLIWPPSDHENDEPAVVGDSEDVVEDQAEPDNPHAGKKALLVDVLAEDEHTIYGEILVGTFGDHDMALTAPQLVEVDSEKDDDTEEPPPSTPTDLKGMAPARRYRFIINAPTTGKVGLIVMEDISRGCPVDLLVKWLNNRGKAAAADALSQIQPPPRVRDRPPWWRIQHHPAVDQDYFRQMIAQGNLERVELVQHAITSGGNREQVRFRLTAQAPEANQVEKFLGLITQWVDDRRTLRGTGRPVDPNTGKAVRQTADQRKAARDQVRQQRIASDADAAQSLAAVLGDKIKEIGFDDGWLVLADGDRTKRISPSRISELFSYEVSRDRRPTNVAFYLAARTKALALQTPLQLSLTWPPSINMEGDDDAEPGSSQPSSTPSRSLEVPR